jgi:hypothetical protein
VFNAARRALTQRIHGATVAMEGGLSHRLIQAVPLVTPAQRDAERAQRWTIQRAAQFAAEGAECTPCASGPNTNSRLDRKGEKVESLAKSNKI